MRELAIKVSHVMTAVPCALCGTETEPNEGPDLFTSDTWEVVCWTCGRDRSPQLVALLMLGVSAESYTMAVLGEGEDADGAGEG
jgi:hypothetical protein